MGRTHFLWRTLRPINQGGPFEVIKIGFATFLPILQRLFVFSQRSRNLSEGNRGAQKISDAIFALDSLGLFSIREIYEAENSVNFMLRPAPPFHVARVAHKQVRDNDFKIDFGLFFDFVEIVCIDGEN